MNKKSIWKKGPPPHVGWWQASCSHDPSLWRWWDGKQWSWAVCELARGKKAAEYAAMVAAVPNKIEWTHHWPESARVSRIALKIAKNRLYGKLGVAA